MPDFKLLHVEDDAGEIKTCSDTLRVYSIQNNRKIHITTAGSKDEALSKLGNRFDGAIIDIKLAGGGTDGNDVVSEIHKFQRIPIAILTGTPENASKPSDFILCYKKGEIAYSDIVDQLYDIYNTGITKIMGGRGVIDDAMQQIFWQHLLPQMPSWKSYRSKGKETEKSILRVVLNHLMELLNRDENPCYPEEMYILPPVIDNIRTGSILLKNSTVDKYVVLTPACDLVIRGGQEFKADKVLLAQITELDNVKAEVLDGVVKLASKIKILRESFKNNYNGYYHWLPSTDLFDGGFINFRWLTTVTTDDIKTSYSSPIAQLSAPFVKDVISRFSAFYARQGQPDFDFEALATTHIT
jgi:hypothetical protein